MKGGGRIITSLISKWTKFEIYKPWMNVIAINLFIVNCLRLGKQYKAKTTKFTNGNLVFFTFTFTYLLSWYTNSYFDRCLRTRKYMSAILVRAMLNSIRLILSDTYSLHISLYLAYYRWFVFILKLGCIINSLSDLKYKILEYNNNKIHRMFQTAKKSIFIRVLWYIASIDMIT